MSNTASSPTHGVVLYGADGTKYVIPQDELARFEVGGATGARLRTVDDAVSRPGVNRLDAYHCPLVYDTTAQFFFHNDDPGAAG